VILVSNRQHNRPVNLRLLRQIGAALFEELQEMNKVELGITLVSAPEMTRLNETFLQHAGSTDVITFDHSEPGTRNLELGTNLHGELFICVDEAILQAKRFRTTWQSEVVRYLVHGGLHLLGHDDHRVVDRQKMKRQENQLLRQLARRFCFAKLSSAAK